MDILAMMAKVQNLLLQQLYNAGPTPNYEAMMIDAGYSSAQTLALWQGVLRAAAEIQLSMPTEQEMLSLMSQTEG